MQPPRLIPEGAEDLQSVLLDRLDQLNAIGAALSSEHDLDCLLERILRAAKDITHAEGGTLYLVTEDAQALRFAIMRNDQLQIELGGVSGEPVGLPDLPLRDARGLPNTSLVAVYSAWHGQTVNIVDAYDAPGFDFSGTRAHDAQRGYRSQSFLTVPMRNHEGRTIGVLQLINALNPVSGAVQAFSAADQRLVESLASQAAVALSNRQLIRQLETLFESLIKMINLAIDEKSPYTRGHCERVPVLTLMLAEAVSQAKAGPLAGFSMNERDRYELKIAGMLHDCGKISTPVHVVDKATKLQTLHDRIHTIDARFAVLRLQTELEFQRTRQKLDVLVLAHDTAAQAEALRLNQEQAARLAQLEADRLFLHQANIGSECMSAADQARVHCIAAYRWQDASGHWRKLLDADEVENLCIRAGTLTQAVRGIINQHITTTQRMLNELPWPAHLQRVPEYAGGHHERMDGKGYPQGLTREQMSVPARIMGIADIFEALTAGDRPYKPGKTLAESLTILGRMKQDGHIDPDLFQLFIRERVYLRYAERFLEAWQIDAVDESRIPGFIAES